MINFTRKLRVLLNILLMIKLREFKKNDNNKSKIKVRDILNQEEIKKLPSWVTTKHRYYVHYRQFRTGSTKKTAENIIYKIN